MDVGIISQLMDLTQKTGLGYYTYNLIKNLIKLGKANNLYLIHCKRCQNEVYTKTHDIFIPKIPKGKNCYRGNRGKQPRGVVEKRRLRRIEVEIDAKKGKGKGYVVTTKPTKNNFMRGII
ncbi:MAG: hypothetical protein ACP5LE_08315 [Thermoplasmata archaeon]